MSSFLPLHIAGIGRYLPERIVYNAEVEDLCHLCEGEIDQSGAGVRERRWVTDETNSSMGAAAAREAVAEAGLSLDAIDLILNASGTAEQVLPDGAPFIQRELGLGDSGIATMSVHTTCLGFLTALDVASSFIATGRYKNILIVNSEIPSKGLNFNQPESASLFGDGAAAVVVQPPTLNDTSGIEAIAFETYGSGAELTEIRGGGTRRHPNDPKTKRRDNLFSMDGEGVYMMAKDHFARFIMTFMPGLTEGALDDVDWVVPHQASQSAINVLYRLGVPKEKVVVTIDRLGNSVSASLPMAFYEAVKDGRIKRGQRILFVGTGAGLSLGALLLRY